MIFLRSNKGPKEVMMVCFAKLAGFASLTIWLTVTASILRSVR
jgi:hypothetical protein